jgi:hypothetical protein
VKTASRILVGLLLAGASLGCDSVELTISVVEGRSGTLDELPPEFSADLERADGWGNPLLYRLLRIDKYNLISAGPDGEFGNADDIVLENGSLYDPMKIYAEKPLKL